MILVIGAGAVGSFVGATLVRGGSEVTLLGRPGSMAGDPSTVPGADPGSRRRTITVVGPGADRRVEEVTLARSADDLTESPELLILAVKMTDLGAAIETAGSWPGVPVLAVENGVGADEMLTSAGRSAVIAGSLTTAVEIDRRSWTIHRRSRGGIGLAPVTDGVGGTIERLVDAFETGGLRARRLDDAPRMRWSKLLANLLGNATSAILDMDPGDVYRRPDLFAVEMRQLRETLAVMRGLGLSPAALPGSDARALAVAVRLPAFLVRPVMVRIVGRGRGGKSPSLRRHLQHGSGESETAWLNGAVAAAASRLDRRAPVNESLDEIVSACSRDAERWAWFRGRPDRLLAELRGP